MEKRYLYETHLHTSESSRCGQDTAATQVRAYKRKGYTGVIITDHFINGNSTCPPNLSWEEKMRHAISGYTAAKKEGDKLDLDVFLGWEFSYNGADFLTYGLGLDFLLANPNVDKLMPLEYSNLVRESGGYIAQAHPFRSAFYIADPQPYSPKMLDGIEVYNASDPSENNKLAREFAIRFDIPMQAGTDSHSANTRKLSGIMLKQRAESIHDIISAIKFGEVELIT